MIPMTFFPPIGLFVLAGFLLGLGWGPMNPLMNSMVQQRVAPHIQGRVFGVQTSLFYASGPIGMFVTGVSVDAFGVQPVYIAAVSILIIFQLFIMFLPDLHDLDREATY
jgi:MFS family permease